MYAEDNEEVFLGMSAGGSKFQVSDETAKMIDEEVRSIVDECYAKAKKILEDNRDKLDVMADALLDYETIDREQIDDIMAGRKPKPPSSWNDRNDDDLGASASDDPEPDQPQPQGPVGGPAQEH